MQASEDQWWLNEVRPEWGGHTWSALEVAASSALVAEARAWAEDPRGVFYVRAASVRTSYGFAVAVAQRSAQRLLGKQPEATGPLAVGLLDEVSVPHDPDPAFTARVRHDQRAWTSVDTRTGYLGRYVQRLREAPLALLRLPPSSSEDVDYILDQVADHRHAHMLPTIIAGTTPSSQITPAFGPRIGWRLGFAEADGRLIGRAEATAAVLDPEHPPV